MKNAAPAVTARARLEKFMASVSAESGRCSRPLASGREHREFVETVVFKAGLFPARQPVSPAA